MASSDIARAGSPDPGSTGLRFIDLLRSFSSQARLALGTRGVLWASAAGVIGLISCLIVFADIGLSLHRSDVDPERRKAREVAAVDNGVRLLMRGIYGASTSRRPGSDSAHVVEEAWRNFANSLELLCRDFVLPPGTKLAATCAARPAFVERTGREIAVVQTGRDETDMDPRVLRDLLDLRDDISDLNRATTAAADTMIGRLVDDYMTALLVLALSTTGFVAAGLVLILLVGRASMDFHTQWQRAARAASDAGASRDLLREVIDALPAGIAVYDADERLVMSNAVADSLTPAMQEGDVTGWTYEMLARNSARRLEEAGRGPQPVEEWIARFRAKDPVPRRRQSSDGRWFEWSEKTTSSGMTVGLRIDVTNVMRHEAELEKARRRYQTLVDSLSDLVYAVDVRGRFTYVSPGAGELLGVPPAEAIGKRFQDWIVPEDVERVIAGGRECHFSPSLEQRHTHFRMRSADGSVRPVELRFRKADGGDPDAAQVGVIRDVTELERTRAEYQSLVDSLADVAYTLDVATGKFIFVSAAARDFFGVAPEKFVGTHFLEHIAPDSMDQVHTTTTREYRDGDPGTFARFRMLAAGGEARHVEVRARRRLDLQGRVISTGVIRDVEEQVQLEVRLESEMTRLRSIVESGGALIVLVDWALQVVMVNSGFTALTGVAAADAVGKTLDEVMDLPLDPERTSPSRHVVKLRDRPGSGSGRERLVAVTATPITDAEGEVSSIVLLGVDDTERREAEQALYDTERFATVGEMAGTMAHEISQPLQVINLSCMLAREELADAGRNGTAPAGAMAFVDNKLERIGQQVEQASRIIGDLRAFVRGTTLEAPEPFNANEAVRRTVDLTDHGVREAGMSFAEKLTDPLPAVLGDISRLEQVLVNLVNNARDAGGRTIAIATGTVEEGGRTYVRIAVEDSGPGIAPEILPRLFNSFVTTKARGKGTGLGLRICRRILEEMGGRISAANRAEGGARFEILLPAR
jgi:PAS domain S-box-containing protein